MKIIFFLNIAYTFSSYQELIDKQENGTSEENDKLICNILYLQCEIISCLNMITESVNYIIKNHDEKDAIKCHYKFDVIITKFNRLKNKLDQMINLSFNQDEKNKLKEVLKDLFNKKTKEELEQELDKIQQSDDSEEIEEIEEINWNKIFIYYALLRLTLEEIKNNIESPVYYMIENIFDKSEYKKIPDGLDILIQKIKNAIKNVLKEKNFFIIEKNHEKFKEAILDKKKEIRNKIPISDEQYEDLQKKIILVEIINNKKDICMYNNAIIKLIEAITKINFLEA